MQLTFDDMWCSSTSHKYEEIPSWVSARCEAVVLRVDEPGIDKVRQMQKRIWETQNLRGMKTITFLYHQRENKFTYLNYFSTYLCLAIPTAAIPSCEPGRVARWTVSEQVFKLFAD